MICFGFSLVTIIFKTINTSPRHTSSKKKKKNALNKSNYDEIIRKQCNCQET